MADFDFQMGAGGGQKIDVQGTFFKYKSGVGAVKVITSAGQSVTLLPGQGVRGAKFDWLNVVDASGAANNGILIGADFEFIDDRISGSVAITAGTLSVVDDGKSRTLAGQAFIGTVGQSTAAGAYATVQLWNPIGSGKNLCVEYVCINTDVDNLVLLSDSIATITGASAGVPTPKKLGGAASVGLFYAASAVGAAAGARLTDDYISAKKPLQIWFKEPVIIVPGRGLVASAQITATITTIYADFEYYEA